MNKQLLFLLLLIDYYSFVTDFVCLVCQTNSCNACSKLYNQLLEQVQFIPCMNADLY